MNFKHFPNRVFNSDYNYQNWFYFHRGNKPIFAWKGAKVVRSAVAIILHASLSVSCASISKSHCSRWHQQKYQPISDIIACGWLVESLKTHRTQNSSNTNFSQLAVYICSQSRLRPVAGSDQPFGRYSQKSLDTPAFTRKSSYARSSSLTSSNLEKFRLSEGKSLVSGKKSRYLNLSICYVNPTNDIFRQKDKPKIFLACLFV